MSQFILATTDKAFEARVRKMLSATNGDLRRAGEDLSVLAIDDAVTRIIGDPSSMPDVIALGPGLEEAQALEIAQRFDELNPEINVILVAKPSTDLLERALRAGARDVVSPEAEDAEMEQVFRRASSSAARRRANLSTGDAAPERPSRIITVISPKGGSGKTTMVSNLSTGLALGAPGEVVVADLDLQFGDVASALRLMPDHSIADAAGSLSTLDAMSLKGLLTQHASGLFALAAPDSPVEGESVNASAGAEIVKMLATQFPYVVVDTSAGLTEHTLAVLEFSTDILFVCTMDVSSVRSLRKVVAAIDQLGMTTQRRHFVLNRAESKVGLDPHDIEAAVGLKIDVSVPSSRAVPLAMNQGDPVITSDPKSPVARQLNLLVAQFAEKSSASVKSRLFAGRRNS